MRLALLFLLLIAGLPARAADAWFTTSDGVRLHYTETGPASALTLVFVPGWTMPGWIFAKQAQFFSPRDRVVLFDPRGQGRSEIADAGYDQERRGRDIGELLARLPGRKIVIGWSLGVLDTLAYVHQGGDDFAGLVLVDNSVGENPPPVWHPGPAERPEPWPVYMRHFVAGMFRTPQSPAYLNALTASCLRTPEADAGALLRYPVPRSYWKAAVLSTPAPVLYIVRPALAGQAENLSRDKPGTSIAVFPKAGHALFVDEPARFNALLQQFIDRQAAP